MNGARLQRPGVPQEKERLPSLAAAPRGIPPMVDGKLIAYLRQAFAPRVAVDADLRLYDRQVGAQEVIQHLQALHEDQNR